MKHRWLLRLCLVVAMALGAGEVAAEPLGSEGFYTGIEGGWSSLVTTKTKVPGLPDIREGFEDGDWNYADHILLGVRAGYHSGPWSIEEEGTYRHNKVFRFFDTPFNHTVSGPFNGQRNAYALMTNVIYTYGLPDIGLLGIVMPWSLHTGLGLGPLYVIDRIATNSNTFGDAAFGPLGCCLHGSTWRFGYQGIAGVRFEVISNVLLDIDFRYVGTPSGLWFTNKGSGAAGQLYRVTGGYQSHDSFFSLIFQF